MGGASGRGDEWEGPLGEGMSGMSGRCFRREGMSGRGLWGEGMSGRGLKGEG